jgi:hypothetical protein
MSALPEFEPLEPFDLTAPTPLSEAADMLTSVRLDGSYASEVKNQAKEKA